MKLYCGIDLHSNNHWLTLENLIAAAGDRCTPYFYRTEDGAEIDPLFERGGKPEMAVEMSLSEILCSRHIMTYRS